MSIIAPKPALQVEDLHVTFRAPAGNVHALRGATLEVARGEIVGLVGESGSGKTVLGLTALGLLPRSPYPAVSGTVQLDGEDMVAASEEQRRARRGSYITAVFQDPMGSLNPSMRIDAQVAEALGTDEPDSIHELLAQTGIPEPSVKARCYPHELSGGLRQRVMIAMALARTPRLVVADEPTTALDVTVQARVLDLLAGAAPRSRRSPAAGDPRSRRGRPYLRPHRGGLCRTDRGGRNSWRDPRPSPPPLHGRAAREPSTPRRLDRRRQPSDAAGPAPRSSPPCPGLRLRAALPGRQPAVRRVAADRGRGRAALRVPPRRSSRQLAARLRPGRQWIQNSHQRITCAWLAVRSRSRPLLSRASNASFRARAGTRSPRQASPCGRSAGVSLTVPAGGSLAIVGESGSGKIDAAARGRRAARPDRRPGHARPRRFAPADLPGRGRLPDAVDADRRADRRAPGRAERAPQRAPARVAGTLEAVGLPAEAAAALPRQLSGGQRQRAAIARAIAVPPALLACDEPVSALDVSLAAQVLNLLCELRATLGIALLFVTHDLAAARAVADEVAVVKRRAGRRARSDRADLHRAPASLHA